MYYCELENYKQDISNQIDSTKNLTEQLSQLNAKYTEAKDEIKTLKRTMINLDKENKHIKRTNNEVTKDI